eukprot:gb/GECG01016322.1/.p1 GENE.gb/GECG01016322.1/~~gb/GECG01016322.1/.p1  ORF type:complete len:652 (+),score=67.78 gb/GECG01016322.1/:1-1956(+)
MGDRTGGPLTYGRLLPAWKANPVSAVAAPRQADAPDSLPMDGPPMHLTGEHLEGSANEEFDGHQNSGVTATLEATEVTTDPPESVPLPWIPNLDEEHEVTFPRLGSREGHAVHIATMLSLRSKRDMLPKNAGLQLIKRLEGSGSYFWCQVCFSVCRAEEKYMVGRVNGDRCATCHLLKFSKDSFADLPASSLRNVKTSDGQWYFSYDELKWVRVGSREGVEGVDDRIASSKADTVVHVRTTVPLLHEFFEMIRERSERKGWAPWDCRLCFHCQEVKNVLKGEIEENHALCRDCRSQMANQLRPMLLPLSAITPLPPPVSSKKPSSSQTQSGYRKSPRQPTENISNAQASSKTASSIPRSHKKKSGNSPSRKTSASSHPEAPRQTPKRQRAENSLGSSGMEDFRSVSSEGTSFSEISEVKLPHFKRLEEQLESAYRYMSKAVFASGPNRLSESVERQLIERSADCMGSVCSYCRSDSCSHRSELQALIAYASVKFSERNLKRGSRSKRNLVQQAVDYISAVLGRGPETEFQLGMVVGLAKLAVCSRGECRDDCDFDHIVDHSVPAHGILAIGIITALAICLATGDDEDVEDNIKIMMERLLPASERLMGVLHDLSKLGEIQTKVDEFELHRLSQNALTESLYVKNVVDASHR